MWSNLWSYNITSTGSLQCGPFWLKFEIKQNSCIESENLILKSLEIDNINSISLKNTQPILSPSYFVIVWVLTGVLKTFHFVTLLSIEVVRSQVWWWWTIVMCPTLVLVYHQSTMTDWLLAPAANNNIETICHYCYYYVIIKNGDEFN